MAGLTGWPTLEVPEYLADAGQPFDTGKEPIG